MELINDRKSPIQDEYIEKYLAEKELDLTAIKMLISLICCYNNKKMLDDFLIDSLQQSKNSEYELIDIDNRNNLFSSVAKAYNQGIQKAKGEWIMFCHW